MDTSTAWMPVSGPGEMQDIGLTLENLCAAPSLDDFDFGNFMTNMDSWVGASEGSESGAMRKARSMAWLDPVADGLPQLGMPDLAGMPSSTLFDGVDFGAIVGSADVQGCTTAQGPSEPALRDRRRRNLEAAFNGTTSTAPLAPVQQNAALHAQADSPQSSDSDSMAAAVKARGRSRCRKPRELPDMVPITDAFDMPGIDTPVKLAASPPSSYPRGGVVKRKSRTPSVAFCSMLSPFSIIKSNSACGGITIAELNSKIEASAAAAGEDASTPTGKGPKTLKLTPGGMAVAMVATPRKQPPKAGCSPTQTDDTNVVLNRIDKSTRLVAV